MSTAAAAQTSSPAPHRLLFLTTICVGSMLLFLVQPMIARMALPRLGGTPAVWNSAMLVYQALLLAGYAYAHWLGRFAPRRQAMIHLALFALAALMLPIELSKAMPGAGASPLLWVPWLLLASIGPLFFVVSAQAPLMQRWFAVSGGGDPYPLYAASNLGSFAGLLAYPLLVEPSLKLGAQSLLWSAGYGALALLVVVCALTLPRATGTTSIPATTASTSAPDRRQMLRWIALAAVPSGLMLSTTLHLTTDIVAMPLIWVIPLGLYLLSFSVAFARRRAPAKLIAWIAPVALVAGAYISFIAIPHALLLVASLILAGFFAVAATLHAQLFDSRPPPEHLTRFYLAMSIGGALGGLFCGLLAPLIFDWTYEYPILLVAAACMLTQSGLARWSGRLWLDEKASRLPGFVLLALVLIVSCLFGGLLFDSTEVVRAVVGGTLALFALLFVYDRAVFAGMVAAVILCVTGWEMIGHSLDAGKMTRSYFGVYTISDYDEGAISLRHGTTVHGLQLRDPRLQTRPVSYYAPESGVGLVMNAAPALFGAKARIGVVGLGSGSLACYARPGQRWKFYEIDPAVERIARDSRNFTFLSRCMPHQHIVIGDARLTLAAEPAGAMDLLVIDAFSSDAVPMHLLTREAFAIYRKSIGPHGLLVVHISNRYLDLRPVVAAAARDGWTARAREHSPENSEDNHYDFPSSWVAMSPDPLTIVALEQATGPSLWWTLPPSPDFDAWTDDYSSILPLLLRK